jgi:hypothetical protein
MRAFAILFILCFSVTSLGQIELSTNKIDESTGAVQKCTKSSYKVFKAEETLGVLDISVMNDGGFYYMTIMVSEDLGCLSKYSGHCMIKLIDNTIIDCQQVTDTDCGDIAVASYIFIKRKELENIELNHSAILDDNLLKLKTIPIEKIRIYGNESYNNYIPNPKFKDFNPSEILIKHLEALK